MSKPEEGLIPPLFENSEAGEPEPAPEPAIDDPARFTTDGPRPEQPTPGDFQIPDLTALRNRLADVKQDLEIVTLALTQLSGYQSAELSQACIRASEFMFWMDQSVRKAEAEELAREAGFEVRQKTPEERGGPPS